jgi:hypothetical protein
MEKLIKTIPDILAAHGFEATDKIGTANQISSTHYRHRRLPVEAQLYYTSGDLEVSTATISEYGVIMRDTRMSLPLLITSSPEDFEAWCATQLERTDAAVEFWKPRIRIIKDL